MALEISLRVSRTPCVAWWCGAWAVALACRGWTGGCDRPFTNIKLDHSVGAGQQGRGFGTA